MTATNKLVAGSTFMAVFLCSLGNSKYTFKNGRDAVFLAGRYLTNNDHEVQELLKEIQDGHPHISTPSHPDEMVIDTKFVDPVELIRAQVRAELLAESAAIRASTADMGTSDHGKLIVANTKTVGEAMSGSTSVDGAPAVTAATAKIVIGPKA